MDKSNRKLLYWGLGLFGIAAATGTIGWYFMVYRPARREQESAGVALMSFGTETAPQPTVSATAKTTYATSSDVAGKQDIYSSLPVGTLPITQGTKSRMAYLLQYALNILGAKLTVNGEADTATMDAVKRMYGKDSVDRNAALAIINDVKKKYANKKPSAQDEAMFRLAQQYFK